MILMRIFFNGNFDVLEDVLRPTDQVSAFERALIELELRNAGGNVGVACAALALPKQTMYHKMQKYGLAAEDYR